MKNVNPHKFVNLCIKKKQLQFTNKNIKLFVKKNMTKFTAIFFTWQWLLKYIFSSII